MSVLTIAIAYAEARSGKRWADVPMWIGQVMLYLAPTILLCSRRRVINAEGRSIALLLPAATFLVLLCYSPGQFRFRDEYQHLGTIQAILSTHHLFNSNTNLPVSPYFPSLEIVTSALSFLGHSSIYIAGTLLMFVAHMITGVGLFLLLFEITRSNRLSGLGVVIYTLGPHYEFFDSYFIYQNVAVPFFILCLLALAKSGNARRRSARTAWMGVGTVAAMITTVSHHITSYALVGFLVCFAVANLFPLSGRIRDYRPTILLLISVGIVTWWDFGVAKGMIGYLKPVIDTFGPTNTALPPTGLDLIGPNVQATKINSLPFIDHYGSYLSTFAFFCLVPYGNWRIWKICKSGQASSALVAMALGSMSFYLLLLVRLFASGGSELSGRMYTFVLIPVGLVSAIAIDSIIRVFYLNVNLRLLRLSNLFGISFGMAAVTVGTVGGIAAGEPSLYARLPGPFVVDGGERSVDDFNLQAGLWVASHLTPGHGMASDAATAAVVANIGRQTIVNGEVLFLNPKWDAVDASAASSYGISYIVVDQRITQELPASGAYFSPDVNAGNYYRPLPVSYIDKIQFSPGSESYLR